MQVHSKQGTVKQHFAVGYYEATHDHECENCKVPWSEHSQAEQRACLDQIESARAEDRDSGAALVDDAYQAWKDGDTQDEDVSW